MKLPPLITNKGRAPIVQNNATVQPQSAIPSSMGEPFSQGYQPAPGHPSLAGGKVRQTYDLFYLAVIGVVLVAIFHK
jgi:hypothetical protein